MNALSRTSQWICDGCGVESALRKIDEWRWVKIKITSRQGSELLTGDYELCPTCRLRLVERANPRHWSQKSLLNR